MNVFRASGVPDRAALADLLNSRGLLGEAAEVGTHRGDFAETLLDRWRGRKLWCVDHYPAGYDPSDPAGGGDRAADESHARRTLARFGGRAELLELSSAAAAGRFADGSLDFVYIDACHLYDAVAADLAAWWPKVRPGGVLAGHDVFCRGHPGVTGALAAFCAARGLAAWLVPGDYRGDLLVCAESYYVERPA